VSPTATAILLAIAAFYAIHTATDDPYDTDEDRP